MVQFPELENKWLTYWRRYKIFDKTLSKPSPAGKFVFFEGPPTANGKPGIHHVLARAFKDLIPRYKTMRGYHVDRKAGWDTQGLPVELQVEKELGFGGKPDIEKYGVKEFNERCRADVWKYKEEWEKLTERMGFWLDLANPYITYERSYIESLWWIFKQIDKAGLLYQDYKVLPHCPRCGTALSSHEVALGYKNVDERAVYVKFKIKSHHLGHHFADRGYILSWTTTPWTLPGNVALAVKGDIVYVQVEVGGESLILSKDRLTTVMADQTYRVIREFTGEELVGWEYEPLFNIKPLQNEKSQRIYTADFVTVTEGTGVVHTAVMYGEDDFNLGKQVGLPTYHTVDESGNFTVNVPLVAGRFVKDKEVEEVILSDLRKRGLLFKEEIYNHDYPFCWRCSTPLLYYAKPSWFIKMSALRTELKAANEKINWYPQHIKYGRFGEWLEGIKDWAVSRERYWGTPLPIWRCDYCQHKLVVGSLAELMGYVDEKQKAKLNSPDFDVHRPFIDEIKWECQQCKRGEMKRVTEVADCWFDSGSMPFAQWGYPHQAGSHKQLAEHYPADYIAEAIDQTRGWFYTLLAVATLLVKAGAIETTPPYRNVICLGHINDKYGQKMSKSKGNIVDPWQIMNKYGADALRLHFYTVNQPGEPKNFDENEVDQVAKRTLLILMNVVAFYELYGGDSKPPVAASPSNNILDRWLLALLQRTINTVTTKLEGYQVTEAGRELMDFVTELSTWYVRRSRERFKQEGPDKEQAVAVLGYSLVTLAKLLAPFTPFIAEEVYARAGGKLESVHLETWPQVGEVDDQILVDMSLARRVVEQALAQRAEAKIKIRQPLRTLRGPVPEVLKSIVADEVNVLEIITADTTQLDTQLDDELKTLGWLREFNRQVNALRKELKFTIKDKVTLVIESSQSRFIEVIKQHLDEVRRAVIAEAIEFSDKKQVYPIDLDDFEVSVNLKK